MRAAFLVLLLWAVARTHPVPGHQPARPRRSAQQEDTASKDDINKLGNLLSGGDGRHPSASVEKGDNALTGDPAGGNAVGEELGEHGGRDQGGRVGQAEDLNWVDHEDSSLGNSLGFLEEDARDADDGDNGEHHGTRVNGLPSYTAGLLDEEDDSGDDTFDENGEEEGGEGPTYVAGADGAGEHGGDAGREDAGAGRRHGDSSSSSSSESTGADHRRYRNYLGSRYERTYRQGGGSSSSQEEETYDFEDEAMQGDDPSVFDGPGSSYKGRRAGPRTPGSSRESGRGDDSHHWDEDDSESPEVEDTDSGEDSPSTEDNSQSEESVASQSEENSTSRSGEDRDGEDSPSSEDEGSKSSEGTTEQSDEELGESPEDISQEVVSTSSERSSSRSQEGQKEDQGSAEDRSALSMPDSESGEDEGEQSKSGEDDGEQSQSTEDTVEESKEDENDSNPDEDTLSTSAESQNASPEDDGSQEDSAGEDSNSTESNNSKSQEEDDDDDDNEESRSQEDATRESSSHGDDSSPQGLESRKRRLGAYRNKPAADYDDNDCQDGY